MPPIALASTYIPTGFLEKKLNLEVPLEVLGADSSSSSV
jgi:hypothetical protein